MAILKGNETICNEMKQYEIVWWRREPCRLYDLNQWIKKAIP